MPVQTPTKSPSKMSLRTKTPQKQEKTFILKETSILDATEEEQLEAEDGEGLDSTSSQPIEPEHEEQPQRKRAIDYSSSTEQASQATPKKKRPIRKKVSASFQPTTTTQEQVEPKEQENKAEIEQQLSKAKNIRKKVKAPELEVNEPVERALIEESQVSGTAFTAFAPVNSNEEKEEATGVGKETIESTIEPTKEPSDSKEETTQPKEENSQLTEQKNSAKTTPSSRSNTTQHFSLLNEPLVRDSVASAIAFSYQRGFLKESDTLLQKQQQPTFEIQHLDSKGNKLGPKEAFKELSDRFHGYPTNAKK